MSEKNHGCSEVSQNIFVTHKHDRFEAWYGEDVWHQDLSVQVRLEPNGDVFLSTQQGHVSTLKVGTVSLPELHAAIKSLIETANDCGAVHRISRRCESHHFACDCREDRFRELLEDRIRAHSTPDNGDYNECDKDPCAWCEEAKALIYHGRPDGVLHPPNASVMARPDGGPNT